MRRVQDNVREHIFDGIVIDTPDGRRFVDAPEVARIFERAVVLTITAEQARELPEQGSAMAEPDAQRRDGPARQAARAARCATAGTGADPYARGDAHAPRRNGGGGAG